MFFSKTSLIPSMRPNSSPCSCAAWRRGRSDFLGMKTLNPPSFNKPSSNLRRAALASRTWWRRLLKEITIIIIRQKGAIYLIIRLCKIKWPLKNNFANKEQKFKKSSNAHASLATWITTSSKRRSRWRGESRSTSLTRTSSRTWGLWWLSERGLTSSCRSLKRAVSK